MILSNVPNLNCVTICEISLKKYTIGLYSKIIFSYAILTSDLRHSMWCWNVIARSYVWLGVYLISTCVTLK